MAVAELNAAGGLLGQQVEVVSVDDYCDGEQGAAAARKLIAAGVVFAAGHLCSGAAIPASVLYEEAGIIMISGSATNPKLTEQGFRNVFRVVNRDSEQARLAGDYLAGHWAEAKIGIPHDGTVYGQGLAEATKSSSISTTSGKHISARSRRASRTTARRWQDSRRPGSRSSSTAATQKIYPSLAAHGKLARFQRGQGAERMNFLNASVH
jgi:ABC-type branched-subunit amino acid transport system substrate-binding protein